MGEVEDKWAVPGGGRPHATRTKCEGQWLVGCGCFVRVPNSSTANPSYSVCRYLKDHIGRARAQSPCDCNYEKALEVLLLGKKGAVVLEMWRVGLRQAGCSGLGKQAPPLKPVPPSPGNLLPSLREHGQVGRRRNVYPSSQQFYSHWPATIRAGMVGIRLQASVDQDIYKTDKTEVRQVSSHSAGRRLQACSKNPCIFRSDCGGPSIHPPSPRVHKLP